MLAFFGREEQFATLPVDEMGDILQERTKSEVFTYLTVEAGPARIGQECQLVRMQPQVRFPRHGHQSDEWGFVIQGEVTEDSGKIYRPGDIVFKDQASQHSFVASSDQPFLFFVIHGGLEFE